MSRRRNRKSKGLSGKERKVYKKRRESVLQQQQLVDKFHFDVADAPDPIVEVPIRSRSDFLPTVEPDSTNTTPPQSSSAYDQLSLASQYDTPAVMRIVRDEDQRLAQPRTRHQTTQRMTKPNPERNTFTWQGYLRGCAWGSAAAATILAVLRIAS